MYIQYLQPPTEFFYFWENFKHCILHDLQECTTLLPHRGISTYDVQSYTCTKCVTAAQTHSFIKPWMWHNILVFRSCSAVTFSPCTQYYICIHQAWVQTLEFSASSTSTVLQQFFNHFQNAPSTTTQANINNKLVENRVVAVVGHNRIFWDFYKWITL